MQRGRGTRGEVAVGRDIDRLGWPAARSWGGCARVATETRIRMHHHFVAAAGLAHLEELDGFCPAGARGDGGRARPRLDAAHRVEQRRLASIRTAGQGDLWKWQRGRQLLRGQMGCG
jgi:hypothetical protein